MIDPTRTLNYWAQDILNHNNDGQSGRNLYIGRTAELNIVGSITVSKLESTAPTEVIIDGIVKETAERLRRSWGTRRPN